MDCPSLREHTLASEAAHACAARQRKRGYPCSCSKAGNARVPRERMLTREAAHARVPRQASSHARLPMLEWGMQCTLASIAARATRGIWATFARRGSARSRVRLPISEQGMPHLLARKAARAHAAGTTWLREGCSLASRVSNTRTRHAAGTLSANCPGSRGM